MREFVDAFCEGGGYFLELFRDGEVEGDVFEFFT